MAPEIHVATQREDERGWAFRVTVSDGGSTTHSVSMSRDTYALLAGGACPPEELLRRSFEFLLEREPKESILPSFDVTTISRYFPEYMAEIGRRVREGGA